MGEERSREQSRAEQKQSSGGGVEEGWIDFEWALIRSRLADHGPGGRK
jgi:hypothetical protein